MQPLSAAELLAIWERGWGASPSERALALLASAYPECGPGDLAALSIGERDGRLLSLREAMFGSQIAAACHCPACGQRLELAMQVTDLRSSAPPQRPTEAIVLAVDEYAVQFRLPTTHDLAAIADESALADARQSLLNRCLLEARRASDEAVSLDRLPERVLAAVVARMAEIDPQANVELAVCCPTCHENWDAAFDIASFFWFELDAWAKRLVREVHDLATAYGWGEAEIVALSPLRRQIYLEMIGT